MAGVGPKDIDFFELHDAFSIMSALSLEACGFAEPGHGPRLAGDGAILPGGSIPITAFGGLKARGHPVGATGVYQLAEGARQLWGEGGEPPFGPAGPAARRPFRPGGPRLAARTGCETACSAPTLFAGGAPVRGE